MKICPKCGKTVADSGKIKLPATCVRCGNDFGKNPPVTVKK
jgi:uncharacterized protein (DUF983 family)